MQSRHVGVIEKILDEPGGTADYPSATELKTVGLRTTTKQGQVPNACLDGLSKPIACSQPLFGRRLDRKNRDRRPCDSQSDTIACPNWS